MQTITKVTALTVSSTNRAFSHCAQTLTHAPRARSSANICCAKPARQVSGQHHASTPPRQHLPWNARAPSPRPRDPDTPPPSFFTYEAGPTAAHSRNGRCPCPIGSCREARERYRRRGCRRACTNVGTKPAPPLLFAAAEKKRGGRGRRRVSGCPPHLSVCMSDNRLSVRGGARGVTTTHQVQRIQLIPLLYPCPP